jgi:hypothetical protein
MHNINQHVSEEEEFAGLPDIAWALLLLAFVPHVLALMGFNPLAMIASCGCFPASMGPFAVAHIFLLVDRLGFTSHMAWISAVSFSLLWSAILCYGWRKNRNITMVVAVAGFTVSALWAWLVIRP